MARVGYIPFDQGREDDKIARKADKRAVRKQEAVPERESDWRFGYLDPYDPEYKSVDTFAAELIAETREEFTHQELQCVYFRMGCLLSEVKAMLESWGFTLARRDFEHDVRGFTSNPHNRWTGNN
jgi:hypothetical protein